MRSATFALVNQIVAFKQGGIEFLESAADVAEHGNPRHALDARPDCVVHVAGRDGLCREMNGLLARSAHPVQSHGRHADRQSGQKNAEPADVGALLAGLRHRSRDDVFDFRRIDAGLFHESRKDAAQQRIGPNLTKSSAAFSKRRPRHLENDGFRHDDAPDETS